MIAANEGRGEGPILPEMHGLPGVDSPEKPSIRLAGPVPDGSEHARRSRRSSNVPPREPDSQEQRPKRRKTRDASAVVPDSSCTVPDVQSMLLPRVPAMQEIGHVPIMTSLGSAFTLSGSHMLPGVNPLHHPPSMVPEDPIGKFTPACRLRLQPNIPFVQNGCANFLMSIFFSSPWKILPPSPMLVHVWYFCRPLQMQQISSACIAR
jgi:hypothetical protein